MNPVRGCKTTNGYFKFVYMYKKNTNILAMVYKLLRGGNFVFSTYSSYRNKTLKSPLDDRGIEKCFP